MKRSTAWALLVTLNVLGFCMLGFYQTSSAGAPGAVTAVANPTEVLLDSLQELKSIRELLKEQNALLRSGEVKVIITELPKLGEPAPARPGQAAPAGPDQ